MAYWLTFPWVIAPAQLNGFSTSDGFCGILEAKNIDTLTVYFRFSQQLWSIRGERNCTTRMFSNQYIAIVHRVMQKLPAKSWADEEEENLYGIIVNFQAIVVKHLAAHQTSKFCTKISCALSFGIVCMTMWNHEDAWSWSVRRTTHQR